MPLEPNIRQGLILLTYATLNVIYGSLNQNVTQGNAIENISIQLDTDCDVRRYPMVLSV